MISGGDLISALRQEKRELESKCTSVSDRLKKVREETAFLWVRAHHALFFLSPVGSVLGIGYVCSIEFIAFFEHVHSCPDC